MKLNPVFEKLYNPEAIKGLEWIADVLHSEGINCYVYGKNTNVNDFVAPKCLLFEDGISGDVQDKVFHAGFMMSKHMSPADDEEFGLVGPIYPKSRWEKKIGDGEEMNILWVS